MSALEERSEEAIFDAARYDLPIPTLDGHKADKLVVNVAGSIELDRTSEEDLSFIEGLRLGQEVSLVVSATVTRKGFTFAAGKEDASPQAGYGVGLKAHSLEVDRR